MIETDDIDSVPADRLLSPVSTSTQDEAIERAILKSSPLPKPDDPSLFKRELTINYKPFEE